MPPLPDTQSFKNAVRIVQQAKRKSHSHAKIARRLFTYERPYTLSDDANADRAFDLFSSVADYFRVPFPSVRAVGSGQLGCSGHKARDFIPKTSDLDLAIVDSAMFSQYCLHATIATKDYSDLTKFPDSATYQGFVQYLAKGIFRPDLMPLCPNRKLWFDFFQQISAKFTDMYSSINCGVYLSEEVFERKQSYDVEILAP